VFRNTGERMRVAECVANVPRRAGGACIARHGQIDWREREDGTVAFSANGSDPIVTFAVADGDGYESYAPALPLLSLAARP
jgi:hypothetical protein